MKKTSILLLLLFGFTQQVFSQCTTNASAFGNNTAIPMYNVQGTVQVVLNTDNTVTVNLMSNFTTAAGPDVRIFLVDRGTLTNAQLRVTSNFLTRPRIEMGLSPASGSATFTKTIPSGMNISEFETVYFYCQAFSQFWDFGSIIPFTTANCSVLGTNEFENDKLKLIPNPVSNELTLTLETFVIDYKVIIYNTIGSVVYNNRFSDSTNTIDVGNLIAGVYIVQIEDDENNRYTKSMIKN